MECLLINLFREYARAVDDKAVGHEALPFFHRSGGNKLNDGRHCAWVGNVEISKILYACRGEIAVPVKAGILGLEVLIGHRIVG